MLSPKIGEINEEKTKYKKINYMGICQDNSFMTTRLWATACSFFSLTYLGVNLRLVLARAPPFFGFDHGVAYLLDLLCCFFGEVLHEPCSCQLSEFCRVGNCGSGLFNFVL